MISSMLMTFARLREAFIKGSDQILPALLSNNAMLVDKLLEQNPLLLQYQPHKNGNLLHWIARHCVNPSEEVLIVIFKHLKQNNKTQLLLAPDKEGLTPLHHITEQGHPSFLATYLALIPHSNICDAVKAVDNNGHEVLSYAKKNVRDAKQIVEMLEPLAIHNTLPPLDQLIESDQVVSDYVADEKENKELAHHLRLSCEIANKLRKDIPSSTTHPSFVELPELEQKKIVRELTALRGDLRREKSDRWGEAHFGFVCKHRVANCGEYARAAQYLFKKHYPNIRAEVFGIANGGGHTFLVIGRDPNSNPADPREWGEHAVVCDPWSGAVYPAKDISTKLHDFFSYHSEATNKEYSILAPFNPRFHRLILREPFDPAPSLATTSTAITVDSKEVPHPKH